MNSEPPVDKDAESYQVFVLKRRIEELEKLPLTDELGKAYETIEQLLEKLLD